MAQIAFTVGLPDAEKNYEGRRQLADVLGIADSGASARGSTYYKSLLACPREHALIYEIGLGPKQKTDQLNAGWLMHLALETYYRTIMEHQQALKRNAGPRGVRYDDVFFHGAEPDASRIAWNTIKPVSQEPGYKEIWEDVSRMVDAYFDRYAGVDRWEILAVEETLEYWGSRRKNIDYTTRLDLIVCDHADGRLWVIEHKSTKWLTRDLIDNYDLDLQICGQMWCLHQCVDLTKYPRLGGVRINIVTRHKQPQYVRHDVLPSKAHLQGFEQTMHQWVATRDFHKSLGWPKALGHCSGYARGYAKCQFYEICREFPTATVHELSTWADPPAGFFIKPKKAA